MSSELREEAFFGKITAAMTHELKNVLAIIGESAGLMEDLLSLMANEDFPRRERFLKILGNIRDQVRRGTELTTHLNRFAHSPDQVIAEIEVDEMAARLKQLTERFARQKMIQTRIEPSGDGLGIRTNPVLFQMSFFAILEIFFESLSQGSTLAVAVKKAEDGGAVHFCAVGEKLLSEEEKQKVQAASGQPALRTLVENLGGDLVWETSIDGLVLTVPKEIPL
jgi:signal transduction histidine kinase